MISVIHSFITQWYSKKPQMCVKSSQLLLNTLSRYSMESRGQETTTVTVSAGSMHFFWFLASYKIKKYPHFSILQNTVPLLKNFSINSVFGNAIDVFFVITYNEIANITFVSYSFWNPVWMNIFSSLHQW